MCAEKLRLLKVYDQATTLLSKCVNTLTLDRPGTSKADYDIMLVAAEEAKLNAAAARLALDQHVATHRC